MPLDLSLTQYDISICIQIRRFVPRIDSQDREPDVMTGCQTKVRAVAPYSARLGVDINDRAGGEVSEVIDLPRLAYDIAEVRR